MDVDVSEEDMMFQAIAMSLRQGVPRASTFQYNVIRIQKIWSITIPCLISLGPLSNQSFCEIINLKSLCSTITLLCLVSTKCSIKDVKKFSVSAARFLVCV